MKFRMLAILLFVLIGQSFGQVEICNNGIDDDADGLIDCEDPDCYLVANTGGIDTDGDGYDDNCDQDDDNDGILDIEENANCTGSVIEEYIINETFETGTSGTVIPKGNLTGVSGIVALLEAYNGNTGNSSTTNVGEYSSVTGFDGNTTIAINANGGGIVNQQAMSSFVLLEGVNLLAGDRYTIEADFSMGQQDPAPNTNSNPELPSNEYGIAIGAPNQDPIWQDDVSGVPDAVFLYGHGIPLIREPNTTLPSISAPPRLDGWYRQYTTYYVKDNGSGTLHLYADNVGHGYDGVGNPTTLFTGTVDYGNASNYSWLNNAAISVSVDEYVDNIVIKIDRCDTDNDDISNQFDRDSDDDGCPDAYEGSNFGLRGRILNADSSFAGSVNANGIPNAAISSSFTGHYGIGTSQNNNLSIACAINPCDSAHPDFTDSDGDGTGDFCDEDSDNDGILDEDELECSSSFLRYSNLGIASGTNLNGQTINTELSGVTASFAADAQTNLLETNSTRYTKLSANAGVDANDPMEVSIDFSEPFKGLELTIYGVDGWTTSGYTNEFVRLKTYYRGNEVDYNIGYTGSSILIDSLGYFTGIGFGDQTGSTSNYRIGLELGLIDSLVIEYHINGSTNPEANTILFAFNSPCKLTDTDNDGIPNHLDLDSDNDCCPDVIEGVYTRGEYYDANDDLVIAPGDIPWSDVMNGRLIGGLAFGSSGLPARVNYGEAPGQGIGSSQDSLVQEATCGMPNITSIAPSHPTTASCPAANNGSIQVAATGDNLEYSTDGTNFQASNILNSLTAGNYTITVRNSVSGCTTDTIETLNAIFCAESCNNNMDDDGDGFIDCADSDCKPTISNVTVTQPTCTNKTGGQITITATGSGILSYSITNEATWQVSNIFSGFGVGQYTIRVKNDSGCETEYGSNPIILDFGTCIEVCNDGIDNDGDGKIDCDDSDCETIENINNINNN